MTPYTIKSILLSIAIAMSMTMDAAWSIRQSTVQINKGSGIVDYAGSRNYLGQTAFKDSYLGNFTAGGTLVLNGGYMHMRRTATSNVCTGTMYYRLYKAGATPGAWIAVTLPNTSAVDASTTNYSSAAMNVNLLTSLTPATYFLEVYWTATGHSTCSTCCSSTLNDNNGGNGFRAYFDYQMFDSFTDGNFTSSPVWSGDNAAWTFRETSPVAAGATSSKTLRSRGPNTTDAEYLSTPNTTWSPTEQHWSFWLGRNSQSYTTSSRAIIWLYANEANLESATVDGYRLVIGDDSGGDEFQFQVVTNGVGTTLITSAAITNGLTDIGVSVHVKRLTSGAWTLYTSTLPTVNGAGQTAFSDAETTATVNQGTATNNTYTPSGTGYFGVVCYHTTTNSSRNALELDGINLRAVFPLQTTVQYTTAASSADETSGSMILTLSITNPSVLFATNATVTLTSGSSSRVGGFTSQVVTFPANSSANQTLNIPITNNTNCDDLSNLVFTISSVTGGSSAVANTPSQNTLVLTDDDMEYPVFESDDFETGLLTDWTLASVGSWTASSTSPINGNYSARHVATGSSGQSYLSGFVDDQPLDGGTTTWQFNLSHFGIEPDQNDKFLFFLAANESNLFSATVDGYAVGIHPANAFVADYITLWKVVDGTPTTAIVTSSLDVGTAHNEIGYRVTRSESGLWTLYLDLDGGFDNMVNHGTGTDQTYDKLSYTGLRYVFKSTTSGQLALDDLYITQKGCKSTYYSRATGNAETAIWSTTPTGPASTVVSSRYANFVVQNAHVVTTTDTWLSKNLNIQSGGTFAQGSQECVIFGDITVQGTWNAGTGTLSFKGSVDQYLNLSNHIALNHLKIDNDGSDVILNPTYETRVYGVVSTQEGTLQTNNMLVLKSTAYATGSIGEILSTGDIIGQVTIERFIPALTNYPYGSWMAIGSPVQSQTIAAWDDNIITSGFLGADYPLPYSFNNIAYYDETVAGSMNTGYVSVNSVTDVLDAERGYMVYAQTASQTIDVKGDIYKGTFNKSLSYTNTGNADDGWNLFVNQYPSQVDFREMVLNGSGVATYYLYDAETNNYKPYNGIVQTGTAPRYINSSQAFFVKASGAGAYLRYEERFKTNQNVSFERSPEENSFFSIAINNGNSGGDEFIVLFLDEATSSYEWNFDAEKLVSQQPGAITMATVSADNQLLSVDSRPYDASTELPVYINIPDAGTYTLNITEVNNLPLATCIYVEDLETGQILGLNQGEVMSFTIDTAYIGNRFLIHFTPGAQVASSDATCFGSENGAIHIQAASNDWQIQLENAEGILSNASGELHQEQLPAGQYYVYLNNEQVGCQSDVLEISITEPLNEMAVIESSSPDHCNETGNGEVTISLDNIVSYDYELINSDGEVLENNSSTASQLAWSNLQADVYQILITTVCGTHELEVSLKDPSAILVDIEQDEIQLSVEEGEIVPLSVSAWSENATMFEWSLDNGFTTQASTFEYEFTEPGSHTLMVLASNESCQAADFVQVHVNQTVNTEEVALNAYVSMTQQEGWVRFAFHQMNASDMKIYIHDASGKLVWSDNGHAESGSMVQVDLSSQAKGVYSALVLVNNRPILSRNFIH